LNKLAFSIDTDDWYHAMGISGAEFSLYPNSKVFLEKWSKPYDFITKTGIKLIDDLQKQNITCTFFVIADEVTRYPEFMERLKDSPHEIACHSLYHSVPFSAKTGKATQGEDQWKRELSESIEILQGYFKSEIIGYRAPGAYFADWMIPILLEAGIKYDSSIARNSLYSKQDIETSSFKTSPYWYKGIVELPWSNYKLGQFTAPVGGAFFFRVLGLRYFQTALRQNLKRGHAQFYMHILDLVEDDFPLQNHKSRPLYWINKGPKTERRLYKLLDHFKPQLSTCKEVYQNYLHEQT